MAASNATAHVMIVESLKDIISSCKKIGISYNPEFPEIRIPALETQLALTEHHQEVVKVKVNAFYAVSNERTLRYARLPSICNRLLIALQDVPMPAGTFRKAAEINEIIQGTRLYKNFSIAQYEAEAGQASRTPEGRSYELLAQYFEQLLTIVATTGEAFQPVEIDLQYSALRGYLAQLSESNGMIVQALLEVHQARQARNELLPVFTAAHRQLHKKVHTYIRKNFGSTSWQLKLMVNS